MVKYPALIGTRGRTSAMAGRESGTRPAAKSRDGGLPARGAPATQRPHGLRARVRRRPRALLRRHLRRAAWARCRLLPSARPGDRRTGARARLRHGPRAAADRTRRPRVRGARLLAGDAGRAAREGAAPESSPRDGDDAGLRSPPGALRARLLGIPPSPAPVLGRRPARLPRLRATRPRAARALRVRRVRAGS